MDLRDILARIMGRRNPASWAPWWERFNQPPVIDGHGTGFIPPRRREMPLPLPEPGRGFTPPRKQEIPFPQEAFQPRPPFRAPMNRNWFGFPMQGG